MKIRSDILGIFFARIFVFIFRKIFRPCFTLRDFFQIIFFEFRANLIYFLRVLVRAYRKRCREKIEFVFLRKIERAFHPQFVAAKTTFAAFAFVLQIVAFGLHGIEKFFWKIFGFHQIKIFAVCIRRKFWQKIFQLVQSSREFSLRMNVGIIIENRDFKKSVQIFENI